jgi:hypothetical protein
MDFESMAELYHHLVLKSSFMQVPQALHSEMASLCGLIVSLPFISEITRQLAKFLGQKAGEALKSTQTTHSHKTSAEAVNPHRLMSKTVTQPPNTSTTVLRRQC